MIFHSDDFDGICSFKLYGWLLLECNVAGCHNDIPDHHDGIGAAHRKKGWKTVLHRTVLCAVL